jgi:hypothetical protein
LSDIKKHAFAFFSLLSLSSLSLSFEASSQRCVHVGSNLMSVQSKREREREREKLKNQSEERRKEGD